MKTAKDLMTVGPACSLKKESLTQAARKMKQFDCGEIPVVDDLENLKPIGVITDRDIVVRAVAQDRNPKDVQVGECMSSNPITVKEETSLDECREIMQKNQIRRLPVVDEEGSICGIVAQADLALHEDPEKSGHVVRKISE